MLTPGVCAYCPNLVASDLAWQNNHMKRLKNDSLPATKSDVRRSQEELARMVAKSFDTVTTRLEKNLVASIEQGISSAVETKVGEVVGNKLAGFKDDIIHEFNVVAENIHKDVAGANADEISLIKNQKLPDHEQRIQRIEKKLDLPVGQAS